MDADGPAQLTSKDPTGFTSPETWNSETAERLCSEPLKSPQKQRMQETYPAEDNTPRRRSARLAQTSTPVRPLNLRIIVPQVEEVIEETDLSNDGAEINQDVEDEPSQVLAERVLSAVSNPSPPPDFLSFPDIRMNTPPPPEPPESQTQSDNTSAAATPPNPPTGLSLNDEGVKTAPVDSTNHTPIPHALTFSSRPSSSPQQHVLSAEKPLVPVSFDNDTLDLPSLVSTAVSSVNPLLRLQTDQGERAVTASGGKVKEPIDDETRDQVAELPTLGEPSTKHKGRRRSAPRSASPVKQRSTSPDWNRLHPPRRSARLSVSPGRTPSPEPTLVLPQISPLRLPTNDVLTRPNPSEIEVSQTADGIDERLRDADAKEVNKRAGRKRKRQDDVNKAIGRQRLDSLSPDSQSVLQQLLPPSRSGSDEDDKGKAGTFQQSLFGPQRILINRPPRLAESTHIQTIDPQPHLGTPLRRVLVSTSTVSGDGPSTRQFGQPLFKERSLDDPTRSPSRRVPAVTRPSSNTKSLVPRPTLFSRQPTASNSTLSLTSKSNAKRRSTSEEPTFSRQPSSGATYRAVLPYPLTQKHPIIPEEPEEIQPPTLAIGRASSEPPTGLFSSIPRSTLRQPTTPSRIPRIGAKPYSRPPGLQLSKLPVLAPTRHAVPSPAKPRNQAENSRSISSSEPKHEPFVPVPSRKTIGSGSKPFVKRPVPTKRLLHPPATTEKPPPSQLPIKSPPPSRLLALPDLLPSIDPATPTEPTKHEQEQTNTLDQSSVPLEDGLAPETLSTSAPLGSRDTGKEEEDTSMKRRTTRSRRGPSALLEEAVFCATSSSPSRPPPRKRLPPDSSGFAGLSIAALKNLTTDNTAKNQKVASLLETEIVRREGKRPESPAVKLRTVAEKALEEKTKKREERAQRRAKRSDSGEFEQPDANDLTLEEADRHRRGAGDEEDYKTPERPVQPLKPLEAGGPEEIELAAVKERRVQWDRFLFTAVFIDEIPEKRLRHPDQNLGKGCLSQAAKSIELDRLGNVQDAGLPLPQLPTEKVVVKRYVYDDDPPPEPEGSEQPETPPVKNTRSKGRKK